MVKISVIVPVYNVGKYLRRCVDSILSQTFSQIEIILVNDGSTDDCQQICESYAVADNRIKIVNKANGGLSSARNAGLEVSSGKYVAFIDGDDYIEKNMLECLYDEATRGNYDIIYCSHYIQQEDKTWKKAAVYDEEIIGEGIVALLADIIAGDVGDTSPNYRNGSVWCGIFKRDTIVSNNIRFVSERDIITEDTVFDAHLFPCCKVIKYIPQSLYYYCWNGNSLSKTFKESKINALENLCHTIEISEFGDKYEVIKQRIMRMFVYLSRVFITQIMLSDLPYKKKKELYYRACSNQRWSVIDNIYPIRKMPLGWVLYFKYLRYNLSPAILWFFLNIKKWLKGF